MLRELRVGNLALVDEVILPIGEGLTVLTGETGAGKSLVAGGLALLCGKTANKDLVRRGEETAYVEGVFDCSEQPGVLAFLGEIGIRIGVDGVLVLRRELRRRGRSRVLINGLVSSLPLLERIGPRLLSVQSQDQQRELGDSGYIRRLLDQMQGNETCVAELADALACFRRVSRELAERRQEQAFAGEQLDLWRYQYRELTAAQLDVEEEASLLEQLQLKQHASALQEGAATALQRLTAGPEPVRDGIGACIATLDPLAQHSSRLAAVLDSLQQAEDAVAQAALELDRFLDGLDLDPAGLDELQERKALYEELGRKYQRDVPGLIHLCDDLAEKIARQEGGEADLGALTEQTENARRRLETAAKELHRLRSAHAAQVARRAERYIRRLALPGLELEFRVELRYDDSGPVVIDERRCAVAEHGADNVSLFVRTNPGERMGDVAAVASGGERSRIHLGLTAMQRATAEVPLLLLDEIDAGLGMDTARPVARLLKELTTAGQVVCITHLPTMAVHGDTHVTVAKVVDRERAGQGPDDEAREAERTVVRIAQVTTQERIAEIARLLGGEGYASGDSEAQLSYARQLLASGQAALSAAAGSDSVAEIDD